MAVEGGEGAGLPYPRSCVSTVTSSWMCMAVNSGARGGVRPGFLFPHSRTPSIASSWMRLLAGHGAGAGSQCDILCVQCRSLCNVAALFGDRCWLEWNTVSEAGKLGGLDCVLLPP